MSKADGTWSCDVKVSMPEPIQANEILVDMGSHVFTANGLFHNITPVDLQEISSPTYAPPVLP